MIRNHEMPTRQTASLPTSSFQPKNRLNLRNSRRCSRYFNTVVSHWARSSVVLPSNCSQAVVDQMSFPQPMAPVSSISVPTFRRSVSLPRKKVDHVWFNAAILTIRGFISSRTSFSHCLHVVEVLFEKVGKPQLHYPVNRRSGIIRETDHSLQNIMSR